MDSLSRDLAANEAAKDEVEKLDADDGFEHISGPLAQALRNLAAKCAKYRHSIGEHERAAYFERLAQGNTLH